MRILIITVCLIVPLFAWAHDIALATFNLTPKHGVIELEMRFDKEDLEAAIYVSGVNELLDIEKRNLAIENYLIQHLGWKINGEQFSALITHIESDGQVYYIEGILENFCTDIQSIEVENSCLIDLVEGHSNIIYAHFYEKTRGFRLTKDRLLAVIDYD